MASCGPSASECLDVQIRCEEASKAGVAIGYIGDKIVSHYSFADKRCYRYRTAVLPQGEQHFLEDGVTRELLAAADRSRLDGQVSMALIGNDVLPLTAEGYERVMAYIDAAMKRE